MVASVTTGKRATEILHHHVTFEAIDRMYLNAQVPSLQTGNCLRNSQGRLELHGPALCCQSDSTTTRLSNVGPIVA